MDFGENLNKLAPQFGDDVLHHLSSQIRSTVDLMALNISEGSIGQFYLEFNKFVRFSIRLLAEVVSVFHRARESECSADE